MPSVADDGFVVRGGALVAWRIPSDAAPSTPFRIVGGHTDSPCLRIKPNPDVGAAGVRAHPAWLVDETTMGVSDAGVFMHCLPVRRGVVVTDGVLDSEASVVLDQAAARLDVQKATLCWALGVTP